MRWFCTSLVLWLALASAAGQSLREARSLYQQGQTDSAGLIYQLLVQANDPAIRMQAITGLARMALTKNNLSAADSLLRMVEGNLDPQSVPLTTRLRLQTVRGEYYRANSQFAKALATHAAVERQSRSLPDSTLVRAYGLYYLALTWEKLTEYDSALVYADRAYAVFQEQLTSDDQRFSSIYNGLGACYFRANQLVKAETFFQKAARMAEQASGSASDDLARCLNNLSAVYRMREQYQKAVQTAERSLQISLHTGDRNGEAGTRYSLAIYHYYLGDYGRARQYLEDCIAIRRQLFPPTHASLIGPYELSVVVLEEAGEYDQMLPILRQARRIIRANYPPGSILEGFNYENVANAFLSLQQPDSALYYVERAHAILPRQLPANDYALAVHYYIYAFILQQTGQLTAAEKFLSQSEDIYRVLRLNNSTENAQNQVLRAQLAVAKKQWPLAERLFAEAIDQIRLPRAEVYRTTPEALIVLQEHTAFQFQRYRELGAPDALQAFARAAYNYQLVSQGIRQQFTDPYTRSILAKNNAETYRSLIGMYAWLHRDNNGQYLESIYTLSEYSRAAQLRDLNDLRVDRFARVPDALLRREKTLRKTINQAQAQYLDQPVAATQQAFLAARDTLEVHIDLVRRLYPDYFALRFQPDVPSLEEMQQFLPPQTSIIQFTRDDSLYYGLVITSARVRLFPLQRVDSVNYLIGRWREALQRQSNETQMLGRKLYDHLWSPLSDALMGEHIIVSPTSAIYYLNFELLTDGQDNYLLQGYRFSYTPALSLLIAKKATPDARESLAVAPGFSEQVKQAYRRQQPPFDEQYLKATRQPWSLRLARKLRQDYGFRALTESQATEQQLKQKLTHSRLIYIGTHAIADGQDPLRSRLVLAKGPPTDSTDGYLHAYEWYGLPLQADLTILNACESGIGALRDGEGMISLAHSIHYAGCPSTALSLWKVDEKTSTQITEKFIQYLHKGFSKSQALQQAKLDYIQEASPLSQHPFYWGGMILMGQDGVVYPAGKARPQWWYLLPLILFIGYILWLENRK